MIQQGEDNLETRAWNERKNTRVNYGRGKDLLQPGPIRDISKGPAFPSDSRSKMATVPLPRGLLSRPWESRKFRRINHRFERSREDGERTIPTRTISTRKVPRDGIETGSATEVNRNEERKRAISPGRLNRAATGSESVHDRFVNTSLSTAKEMNGYEAKRRL